MSRLKKQEGDITDAKFYIKEAISELESKNDKLHDHYLEALYHLNCAEKKLRVRRIAENLGKSDALGGNEASTSNSDND